MDIQALLRGAKELGASDFHAMAHAPPVFRIHGELQAYGRRKLKPEDTRAMVVKLLTPEQLRILERVGEYDASYAVPNGARFRLNCFRQQATYAIAARVIPSEVPTVEELELPPILKQIARRKQGMVLVTGPSGSGKTTTQAAMVNEINISLSRRIVTLENPIEYVHKHKKSLVLQREVGADTETFASGLRAALRQDPDVIMVGEIRDLETTRTAISAAETGHLVLASMHTLNAPTTLERIVDFFPTEQTEMMRHRVAAVLVATITQRLFARVMGTGLVPAVEVMLNKQAFASLIRQGKYHQIPSLMQTSKDTGMQTLAESVHNLVRRGLIHRDEELPFLD